MNQHGMSDFEAREMQRLRVLGRAFSASHDENDLRELKQECAKFAQSNKDRRPFRLTLLRTLKHSYSVK